MAIPAYVVNDTSIAVLLVSIALALFWGWKTGILRKKPSAQTVKKVNQELKQLKEDLKTPLVEAVPPPTVASPPPVEPAPSVPPSPSGERTFQQLKDIEELAMKNGIDTEIVKLTNYGRAVITKGHVRMQPRRTDKDIFTFDFRDMTFYIDFQKIQEVQVKEGLRDKKTVMKLKLVYNILYSEPMNADGTLTWSQDFENILADEAMDQYIVACTYEAKFELTRAVIILVILVFLLALPLGILINAITHLIPTTVFHWVR